MKKLATLAVASALGLTLTACSSGPDPDRELSLQERDNLIATCLQSTKDEVYELGGYGGEWLQYDEWDLERGPIEGDTQPFTVSGTFTSDIIRDIPVTCESELNVETSDATTLSHTVEGPDINYREIATTACHDAVLDDLPYPSGVKFIETVDTGDPIRLKDGAWQFGMAGDMDVPNAFGTPERQGFLCVGLIIEESGDVRLATANTGEWLRGVYTNP